VTPIVSLVCPAIIVCTGVHAERQCLVRRQVIARRESGEGMKTRQDLLAHGWEEEPLSLVR